ncbi:TonB-dependent receptor [Sphingomonas sp. GB1N7]|uniref:TonB-dependent receptor n=1 Tax=Parasphingomonas caseinilytica TaxID=3096158 RepID=UPI002FC60E49
MTRSTRALRRAVCVAALVAAMPAYAEEAPADDILIVAQKQQRIENAPSSRAEIDARDIAARINAASTEDTLKYLPSLIVRKRNIGDTQAPLATRTSGLGASARSLVYADGALLSALIGNNNTNASPRWGLVSPQEIARIDVLYGPFSAAYPGNSLGAVVNITTRLPDALEATVTAGTSVQDFDQYGTRAILPAYQIGATIGDRFGALSVFASAEHIDNRAQPLTYITALRPAATSATGTPATGGFDDLNRTGAAIRVLGAGAIEHQLQDRFKLKAALDLGSVRLTYVGGLFLNDVNARADTYLNTAAGLAYAGTFNLDGRSYTIAPATFSAGVYHSEQRHISHSLSASGGGGRFDWQVIGTLFDYDKDIQRTPTTALPNAQTGGAGTITRLDGSGWRTLDAKGAYRAGGHTISAGGHYDRFEIASNRYLTTDWISGGQGAANLQSRGKTRTAALWLQDAWAIVPGVTLTAGGRYEWWKAYDGANLPALGAATTIQPQRSANRFSPKASLAWQVAPTLTARLSFGEALRFPTVGELYQVVTTPVATVPNPNLKPEHAQSEELAIEQHDDRGTIRLSVFNEIVRDALISQSGILSIAGVPTTATFIQNVDRTRARGAELAVQRRDVVPRFDLSGSVTYADATTRADTAFPAAVGKLLPGVPHWKATVVGTWRPTDQVSLTAAGRYTSRLYGQLDNLDLVGNTYQGFYKYLVVDLRAQFRIDRHYALGLGVDNVNNDKYFLFHPFPQRTFRADVTWSL